jgi:uncharacterized protein YciI
MRAMTYLVLRAAHDITRAPQQQAQLNEIREPASVRASRRLEPIHQREIEGARMPLFTYSGFDSPRGLELRPSVRPRHLAHLAPLSSQGRVRFAGPLLDERGNPCGSLVVFEAESLAAARKLAESDPYLTEGVFARIELRETKQVLPEPAA